MANATKTDHESKRTTDHDEIRRWAEARGGKPTSIEGTERKGEEAGLLRIDFPAGAGDPPLEPISWKDFFEKFDKEKLAMVYQEEKANGEPSFFCKFVNREKGE
ncbi:hypothetical protein AYO47_07005 [Planctomyces sp. SCGC AG-212-M04]|nr:hypothetical protein AYO47_07005 [Planctomyces sp. SCGC AG-212-M04]